MLVSLALVMCLFQSPDVEKGSFVPFTRWNLEWCVDGCLKPLIFPPAIMCYDMNSRADRKRLNDWYDDVVKRITNHHRTYNNNDIYWPASHFIRVDVDRAVRHVSATHENANYCMLQTPPDEDDNDQTPHKNYQYDYLDEYSDYSYYYDDVDITYDQSNDLHKGFNICDIRSFNNWPDDPLTCTEDDKCYTGSRCCIRQITTCLKMLDNSSLRQLEREWDAELTRNVNEYRAQYINCDNIGVVENKIILIWQQARSVIWNTRAAFDKCHNPTEDPNPDDGDQ